MQKNPWSSSVSFKLMMSIVFIVFFFLIGSSVSLASDFVKKTQEALVEKGFDPGPVDGLWGPKTESALVSFQEKQGFFASGLLDRQTRRSLFSSKGGSAPQKTASVKPQAKAAPTKAPEPPKKEAAKAPVKEKPAAPKKKETPVKKAEVPPPAAPAKVEPIKEPKKEETKVVAKPAPQPKPAPAPAPKVTPKAVPEIKTAKVSSPAKSSGPCPQTRKTKSAPSNFKRMDKTKSANLENGKKLFSKTAKPLACKQCHGDKGDGLGKLGKALKPQPRNFTCADTMKGVTPGQMFWVIKNGSAGTGMTAHKKTLKDKEIWDVVKYIQSTFMGGEAHAKVTDAPAKAPAKTAAVPVPEKSKPASPPAKVEVAAKTPAPAVDTSAVSKLPKGVVGKGKYEESSVSGGGSITGVVRFAGNVPDPIMEDLSKGKNVEFCSTHPDTQGTTRPRQKVVVAGGMLKDTVVFIQNIEKGKAWPKEAINFDFKDCDIFPKVSVIRKTPKGVKTGLLTITNQDPDILHNPHGYSVAGANRKTLFNKPLPSKGDVADVTKTFKRFKPSKDKHFFLQCDQHNFMEADARVIWNPYYSLSGADGGFKVDQIPPGKYWVTAWHPYIGEVSKEVTVTGGSETKTDFQLTN